MFDKVIGALDRDFRIESEAVSIDARTLGQISAEFTETMDELRFSRSDCIVVACDENFYNALAVISLLARRQDFFLTSTGSVADPPSFCRGRVVPAPTYPYIEVEAIYRERGAEPLDRPQSSSPAARMFLRSSGSTGSAKLVSFTHDNLIGNARNCVHRFELKSSDQVAVTVPVYHMLGLGAALIPALLAGASVDLQSGTNVLKFIDRERRFEPTVAFMTPSFAIGLLKGRRGSRIYRLTVTAGDRMNPKHFDDYEKRFGPVVQLYGSTEMGAVAATRIDDSAPIRKHTVGKPMPGVCVRTPVKQRGPMRCKHPFGFEGYVDDKADTVVKRPGAWFETNDVAEIDGDGNTIITGRMDNATNRDGYLLMFSEIETALENIDGVESAVVTSRGVSDRGAIVVAVCLLSESGRMTVGELRSRCRECLPKHLVPDQVKVLGSFPVLPSGKLDRQSIIAMTK